MTVTIDLGPELEAGLRDEAAREGMDASGFILNTLKPRLRRTRRGETHLSKRESELLLKINAGLPETTWERYHALVARRKAETLTPEEHAELILLSHQVERDKARRIGHLIELDKMRHTTLEAVMQSLGISPRPYV